MSHPETENTLADRLGTETQRLYSQYTSDTRRRVDAIFAWLMAGQWVFAIGLALALSPYGWEGSTRTLHVHLHAALFLGGGLSLLPILLAWWHPGSVLTRHVVAVSQLLWSALLIHLTGGRIETHFHIFGSLAFLAFYRDWKVLLTATLTIGVDHFLRGLFWPESIYGTPVPQPWRVGEHLFWVAFMDIVLFVACRAALCEVQEMAKRRAMAELAYGQLSASLTQLQATQAQLLFADRLAAMGRLAAGVGHEINNPLAYVISNINYVHRELGLLQGASAPETQGDLLAAIADAQEGAERVRIIVQDLKMLAQAQDFRSLVAHDTCNGPSDLKAIVDSAVRVASRQIRRRARLVTELDAIPLVQGNEGRLRQVFLNLLINAAQAIPEGRVEQNEIRVVARQVDPQRVSVEVRDTGCGIPAENLEHIFDPFFTTKPPGEGTGLGLSVSHSIITAMGGAISVESDVGSGTTIRVNLPTVDRPLLGAMQPSL
ncbi:His Kinase A (phospho-acceptor) domain-containing protein [Stigmatella aurantiaca]|uniref:histidine kinase n=1 Tax=Stigmatella aurantiaca TaxID=41 RepID=A0A1H8AR51_STIAU|nr:ATP-binding protein [Stigmatella aurantiaca]SEM73201.1 His Kinase A (phospho-acceptor) domain-containing protein [Stigmatella aurantiaca]